MWSRKCFLRRNVITWSEASLSVSLYIKDLYLSFEVAQLLSSRLYSPMFSGCEKNTQSCEILVLKIQQVMFLTSSSYSINILPNYIKFLNLTHSPISRNLLLVIWYSDSKTNEYSVLSVFFAISSLLQELQQWSSFLCVILLLPTSNNSKTQ